MELDQPLTWLQFPAKFNLVMKGTIQIYLRIFLIQMPPWLSQLVPLHAGIEETCVSPINFELWFALIDASEPI
jgi:hypothetical protein